MSWLLISFSPVLCLVLHCLILVQLGTANDPVYFCSGHLYDNPSLQDCSHALAALPQVDPFWRYHVEPQIEVAPPEYDWLGWADQRPSTFRQKIAQIPKFWSSGKQIYLDSPIHQYIIESILEMMKNDLRESSRILQYCPHELCRRQLQEGGFNRAVVRYLSRGILSCASMRPPSLTRRCRHSQR